MNLYTVPKKDAGLRLDKYLERILCEAPKSFLYKSLRNKDIRLNGKKADGTEVLREGDEVLFRFPDVQFKDLGGKPQKEENRGNGTPENKETPEKRCSPDRYCTIVFEDEDILIADKKAGVLSQKAKPGDVSLNEILLEYAGGSSGAFTPSVCNRLDRNTTGLITFAKTYRGARELNACFQSRDLEKYYLAAVFGEVKQPEKLSGSLRKDRKINQVTVSENAGSIEAQRIETSFEPLCHGEICGRPVTLLKVHLITGKTHQIRAHLLSAGYPVVGDMKYFQTESGDQCSSGPQEKEALRKALFKMGVHSQMLHSRELTLPGRGTFLAPVPKTFRKLFPDWVET